MSAEAIAKALGGRRAGGEWMAPCPAHDDRTPSLSLRDANSGKVLVHCYAGCDQGRVIAALRARGVWDQSGRSPRSTGRTLVRQRSNDAGRGEVPVAIWQGSRPPQASPVETYLASRGLHLPPLDALRFIPA